MTRSGRGIRRLGAAIAVAALLALAGATSALGCSPPLPREGDVRGLQAAIDRSGAGIALWQRYKGAGPSYEPRGAVRRPDGTWAAISDPPPLDELAYGLQVAIDGGGNAVALWSRQGAILTATRPAAGPFGPVETLSATASGSPRLALDDEGNALVVWVQGRAPGIAVVQAVSRPAGGSWGAPQDISDPSLLPWQITVALSRDGRALVAWSIQHASTPPWFTSVVQAADRPAADAAFGPVATLSGPGAFEPAAAVGPSGQGLVVWTVASLELPNGDRQHRATQAAEQRPDGTWSPPRELAAPGLAIGAFGMYCGGEPDTAPHVAMDAAGNAVALWTAPSSSWVGTVQWAARAADGDWTPSANLGTGPTPFLAVSPTGETMAAWMEGGLLRAARRQAGGAFGPVEDVGPNRALPSSFLAMDPRGRSIAVWGTYNPPRVLASPADPAAPGASPQDLSALVDPPVAPPEPDKPEPPAVRPIKVSGVVLSPPCPPRRGIRGARMLSCSPLAGAALSFRLSAPARVRVTLQRGGRGAAIRSLTVAGRAGINRLRIRLRAGRALVAGAYLVRLAASGAGGAPVERAVRMVVRQG
jgi:hypothetical protein